jgi:TRAP-type mannitol/chloroaromatic compound transport system permease small subunit
MPENWWARYIPFFWYLFGFFIMASDYSIKKNKHLFLVFSIIVIINNFSFFVLNTVQGVLHTIQVKQFFTEIKKSDNDTLHIILEREHFKYAITEKSIFYNVDKNIIFIENEEIPFTNGVLRSYIKGWY